MKVTAWNNGSHHASGAGYGVKIALADRDQFFRREWGTVLLELEGETQPIACNIDKDTFWGPKCRELISSGIGQWLRKNGLALWKGGCPPKLNLIPVAGNKFRLQSAGGSLA